MTLASLTISLQCVVEIIACIHAALTILTSCVVKAMLVTLELMCHHTTNMRMQARKPNVQKAAIEEVKNKLSETVVCLEKSLKVSSKLHEKAAAAEAPTSHLESAVEKLCDSLQKGEIVASDLGYLIKFGKEKTGEKLSIDSAVRLQHKAAATMQDVLECTKTVRAHMPKKVEE